MTFLRYFYHQKVILFKDALERNEIWRFALSIFILLAGFILLEISWRCMTKYLKKRSRRRILRRSVPYLAGFLPAFRLAFAILLLKLAELPLILPEQLRILVHGLESFFLALAFILFFFQMVALLQPLYRILPSGMKNRFSKLSLDRMGNVLRITGIILVALSFIYTQKSFFPQWLWGYSWWRYLMVLAVIVVAVSIGRFVGVFFSTMLVALKGDEEQTRLGLVLEASLLPIHILLVMVVIYGCRAILALPDNVNHMADVTINVLGVLMVVFFAYRLLNVVEFELTKLAARDDNELDQNFVQMIRMISRVFVVTFGTIYLLRTITGKPMNTLLAGLGIGGLAVALAAQDTLKNLFGSIMIMIDKPLAIGDWVKADGVEGIVEEIGFRSTRIRTFSGHVISIPNEKMASNNIENVQRRPCIRRWINITITYDTPVEKVERAVQIIKDILAGSSELSPDFPFRVVFNEFNDDSLNILVVYWFHRNDFWAYQAFNEKVNFKIMRAFESEGIEFAFPTTTTYLAQDERRPLSITVLPEPVQGEREK